jgi:hypothetical protein
MLGAVGDICLSAGATAAAAAHAAANTPATASAPAAAPTPIGKFDTWTAYTMPDGAKLICYALSKPSSMPDKSKRSKVYLMVTHRPAEKTLNVVSISLGYPTATNGSAAVNAGKQKFDFFTRDETAWSRDSDTDKAVVTSMRKAQSLSIKAKPAKSGTETTDSYSLIGFPAALDAIDKACKVKR